MSKNSKIILAFLIFGVIFGLLDSILFYGAIIGLPAYILYKVFGNSFAWAIGIIAVIFISSSMDLGVFVIVSFIFALACLFGK